MRALELRDGSQVAEARRAAVSMSQAHGFGEEDAGRVAIVATELATNLLKHAGGGVLLVGGYDDSTGSGIECLALDKGPGIADVTTAARDGHSTAGSSGTGLGAVVRGSHVADIYSAPGLGTAVLARLAPGQPSRSKSSVLATCGVVTVAMPGEEACGDSWCKKDGEERVTLMVADGLGHGPSAAEASHAAVQIFTKVDDRPPSDTLAAMHAAMRATRGAAIAIARVDRAAGNVVFAGVGNVAATLVDADLSLRRMVSNNGTIGHIAKHMRDFTYPIGGGMLVILASDGLATSWRMDAYPGLSLHHPTLIAGVLYRDFNRGRDDVTVLVCRVDAA